MKRRGFLKGLATAAAVGPPAIEVDEPEQRSVEMVVNPITGAFVLDVNAQYPPTTELTYREVR